MPPKSRKRVTAKPKLKLRKAPRTPSRTAAEKGSLESFMHRIVKKGLLKDAAGLAILAQRKAGLAAVYKVGNRIVRKLPTGQVQLISTLVPNAARSGPMPGKPGA
jgi:hypothetical protein